MTKYTKFIDTSSGKLHLKLAKIHCLSNRGLSTTGDDGTMSLDDFLEHVGSIRVPSSEEVNPLPKEMAPFFRHPWPP